MRIRMENFQARPRSASAMHGVADLVFEQRGDVLRTGLQVGVAVVIGMLLGTFGRIWLGF